MAEKHPSVIGTFYKVGKTYYYDRCWNGKRVRITTRCKTLEEAAKWVRSMPFGSRYTRAGPKLTRVFFNRLWDRARHNAKPRGIPFELKREDVDTLYAASMGYCQVSGLPFNTREIDGVTRRPYMPSIDRIDGMLGYSLDNCRMVCAAVNLAMNEFGEDVLWEIASSMMIFRRMKATQDTNTPHQAVAENVKKDDKLLIAGG